MTAVATAVQVRTQCRHGASLAVPCTSCEKTPECPRTWLPSDELDAAPIGTAEEERRRAKAWMDTAAMHTRNEEYWRDRAKKAETALSKPTPTSQWARVELKGSHAGTYWGLVDEVQRYRRTFCRIRIPDGFEPDWKGEELFGGEAIFHQSSCTEEDARRNNQPAPAPAPQVAELDDDYEVLCAAARVSADQVGAIEGDEDCHESCSGDFSHHWVEKQSMQRPDGDGSPEHPAERENLAVWIECLHCPVWARVKE